MPAAVALFQALAWELPYATGAAIKRKKKMAGKTIYSGVLRCPYWVFLNPFSFLFFFFFFFLGLHPWHVEVPGLGVKPELQPLAEAAATAMWDSR